jgi:hypothetical protein
MPGGLVWPDNGSVGRTLIIVGLILVVAGLIVIAAGRLPIRFGHLPGDIVWKGKNTTFYFPLTTLILVNVAIGLVLWVVNRFR